MARTSKLDALDLLNAKTNQIAYAYGSLSKTDSLSFAFLPRSKGATHSILCSAAGGPGAALCKRGFVDRLRHPIGLLSFGLTGQKRLGDRGFCWGRHPKGNPLVPPADTSVS